MAESVALLAGWESFYVITGSAAAALAVEQRLGKLRLHNDVSHRAAKGCCRRIASGRVQVTASGRSAACLSAAVKRDGRV